MVRNYADQADEARKDWSKVANSFDRSEEYITTEMNCCTKCWNALREVYPSVPLKCQDANFGIGTKRKITRGALTGEDD